MGSIITPAAAALAVEPVRAETQSVSQHDLLERDPGPEAQRPRAQTADRARGHLDHPRPAPVDAQLGVHRTFAQPERRTGPRGLPLDRVPDRGRVTRRRDVDRLFEDRSDERVRLVEQGEHMEPSVVEKSLDGHLVARHILLDEHMPRVDRTLPANVPTAQQLSDPLERGDELHGGVRADHAATRGEAAGLQDAGVRRAPRRGPRVGIHGYEQELRSRQARLGESHPHRVLVARGQDRLGRVVREPQSAREARAASSVVSSSVPTTARRGRRAASAAIAATDLSARRRSIVTEWPGSSVASACRRSVPTTTSTASARAASRNA